MFDFISYRTPVICQAPVINEPNPSTIIVAGKSFSYQIPELTFLIPQGGNTRQLSLTLTQLSNNFPSKCWYSFNQTSQTISGLTYKSLVANQLDTEFVFEVTATHSCGGNTYSVATNLSLNIPRPSKHCFEIMMSFKTPNNFNCEWVPVKMFADKVAEFYGFNSQQDIIILDYSKTSDNMFTVKMTFSTSKLRCEPCDFIALVNSTGRIIRQSEMTIRPEFVSFMSPTFTVTSAQAVAIDTCIPVTTSAPTSMTTRYFRILS